MVTHYSDYTQIVEDGGKRYLLNTRLFEEKRMVLNGIDRTLEKVRDWLKENDFPATGEFILGSIFDADFLRRKLVEDTEKSNTRLKLPKHVAKIHVAAAEAAAADLNTDEIAKLRAEFYNAQSGFVMRLAPEHFYQTPDGVKVERKTVEDALRRECLKEIPRTVEEAAEALKECVLKLRPFMDMGVPIPEAFAQYIGNYLKPHKYFDFADILPVVAFLSAHQKPTRALVRLTNPDQFYLLGGEDTPQEKQVRGGESKTE
ncbi:MAG: hypothetical protein J5917_05395 [Bacteroidales bacterium]|nr:hypothetical protein [Bacteroidales bacterium]